MAPITWKNVGSTISGGAAGKTMEGGVKTIQGAFDPLERLRKESQDVADQNVTQAGVNLNRQVQEGYQDIGSLAEYNRMKSEGQFDDAAARERLGYQYDAGAAKVAREDRLGTLRKATTDAAMTAGGLAGAEGKSSLAGGQAFKQRVLELGGTEVFANKSATEYMDSDTINKAQYAEDIKTSTTDAMAGFTPTTNVERETKLAEMKLKYGDSFDIDQARTNATARMTGAATDVTDARAREKLADDRLLKEFDGKSFGPIADGAGTDDFRDDIDKLPAHLRAPAYDSIQKTVETMAKMDPLEKEDFSKVQGDNKDRMTTLTAKHTSEMSAKQAEYNSVAVIPEGNVKASITALTQDPGFLRGIESVYADGVGSGAINAVLTVLSPELHTGNKAADGVRRKAIRLLTSNKYDQNTAMAIIMTAEQLARTDAGIGEALNYKTFENEVSRLAKNATAAKVIKSDMATLATKHNKETSQYSTKIREVEHQVKKALMGNKKVDMSKIYQNVWSASKTKFAGKPPVSGKSTIAKAAGTLTTKAHYKSFAEETAKKYDVDSSLVNAVIESESNWKADAESGAGAKGLMQIMPATAKDLGIADRGDAKQSIEGGTKYLAQLSKKYKGNIDKTLAAYNWGMGNVDRKGLKEMPKETRDYIKRVKKKIAQTATSMKPTTIPKAKSAPKIAVSPKAKPINRSKLSTGAQLKYDIISSQMKDAGVKQMSKKEIVDLGAYEAGTPGKTGTTKKPIPDSLGDTLKSAFGGTQSQESTTPIFGEKGSDIAVALRRIGWKGGNKSKMAAVAKLKKRYPNANDTLIIAMLKRAK